MEGLTAWGGRGDGAGERDHILRERVEEDSRLVAGVRVATLLRDIVPRVKISIPENRLGRLS